MRAIAKHNSRFDSAGANAPRGLRRGFTLLELLVVIAISAILFTIVFKPLIDGFNLTRRAQTQIASQTYARESMREISAILGNAVYVYDNVNTPINLWFYDKNNDPLVISSQFGMIEYVPPARQLDQTPGATPIDPTTGLPIYDSSLPAGQRGFALPLAPGRTLGRLFIGLQDNRSGGAAGVQDPDQVNPAFMPVDANGKFHGYANRWDDPNNASIDNRYTLYKAEVLAYIPDPDAAGPNAPYIPNLKLFRTRSATTGQITNSKTDPIELHDPNFFYDNTLAGGTSPTAGDPAKWALPGWRDLNGDGKVQIGENWRAAATSMLPLNSADMVQLTRDDSSNAILYDNNGYPTVRPLASFSPSFVQNDPGTPAALEATGSETPAAVEPDSPGATGTGFAAPAYASQYAHWITPFRVLVYRSDDPSQDPLTANPLTYFEADNLDLPYMKIYQQSVAPGTTPPLPANEVGPQLVNGEFMNKNASLPIAFTADVQRGMINFAFPQSVLVRQQGPGATTLPAVQRYSPADINAALDPNSPNNVGQYEKRYLSLRAPLPTTNWPLTGGTPLNAAPPTAISPINLYQTALGQTPPQTPRVRIVPGSERVFGPDQRPGPHYGLRIQYTRVSANAGSVGLNEYKIHYEDVNNAEGVSDVNDPRVRIGYIEFDSDADSGTQPNAVDNNGLPGMGPNSLPIHRVNPNTGLIDQTLWADPVEVSYQFQMNRPSDVVKIDYMTRELMNVTLQIRLYDPSSASPQLTEVSNRIKVRNLQR
jgi:prepilin-type N-terminal cleavage/methylation domain-containing protein